MELIPEESEILEWKDHDSQSETAKQIDLLALESPWNEKFSIALQSFTADLGQEPES